MPNAKYPDDITELFDLSLTKTYAEMAEFYGVHENTVFKWCKKFGIVNRNGKRHRKYELNEDFFQTIDTPEKAYILGFFIADGSVSDRSICIGLHPQDKTHLVEIAYWMGSTAPIYDQKQSAESYVPDSYIVRINFSSLKIVDDLRALGVTNNKSLTVQYPTISSHLERHLIRGIWDGDGTIGPKRFECAGNRFILRGIQKAVKTHTGHVLTHVKWYGHHRLMGYRRDKPVIHWLYEKATIRLHRKYISFLSYWR